MEDLNIQELFDKYEDLLIEIELAQKAVEASRLADLSEKDYVTVEQAEKHIQQVEEYNRKKNHLEEISSEWGILAETLADKLCLVNTKIKVRDKKDNTDVLIYCKDGAVNVEEMA